MKYVLIAVFIALLATTVVIGWHKGFLRTLVSMGAFLISLLLVFLFSGRVTELLVKNTDLREKIEQSVYERLIEKDEEDGAVVFDQPAANEVLPYDGAGSTSGQPVMTDEQQREAARDSFIPDVILDAFNKNTNPFGSGRSYNEDLAAHIADLAMKACGILITLIASFIIIRVVIALCGLMNKVPILGTVNRFLGAVLGLAQGLIIIWVFCFAVTSFASTGFGSTCLAAIKDSRLLSIFYNGALSFQNVSGLL